MALLDGDESSDFEVGRPSSSAGTSSWGLPAASMQVGPRAALLCLCLLLCGTPVAQQVLRRALSGCVHMAGRVTPLHLWACCWCPPCPHLAQQWRQQARSCGCGWPSPVVGQPVPVPSNLTWNMPLQESISSKGTLQMEPASPEPQLQPVSPEAQLQGKLLMQLPPGVAPPSSFLDTSNSSQRSSVPSAQQALMLSSGACTGALSSVRRAGLACLLNPSPLRALTAISAPPLPQDGNLLRTQPGGAHPACTDSMPLVLRMQCRGACCPLSACTLSPCPLRCGCAELLDSVDASDRSSRSWEQSPCSLPPSSGCATFLWPDGTSFAGQVRTPPEPTSQGDAEKLTARSCSRAVAVSSTGCTSMHSCRHSLPCMVATRPGPIAPAAAAHIGAARSARLCVQWEARLPHGHGILRLSQTCTCLGTFLQGVLDGPAIMRFSQGDLFVGGTRAGLRQGPGLLEHADAAVYSGEFSQVRCLCARSSHAGLWQMPCLADAGQRQQEYTRPEPVHAYNSTSGPSLATSPDLALRLPAGPCQTSWPEPRAAAAACQPVQ